MIALIVYIALIGLVVWGITALIPMPPKFQQIIYVLAIICVILIVLNAFGLLSGASLNGGLPNLRR